VADDPGWRDRCARQWRAARIKRFEKRQQEAREWINFADIADWCSKEDQSILPNERKREATFDTLASDLLAGEFEENGRSRVLFLHPTTAKARMTPEWFKNIRDHNYDGDHGRLYLAHCWIPRRLFERWLARHRLPESPPRFNPVNKSTQPARSPQRPREKRRPSLQRAQVAIKAAYPNGVPDQATEPNKILCQRVSEKLTELNRPKVSDDTILRAAGRRK
jgi:hypothetical protein